MTAIEGKKRGKRRAIWIIHDPFAVRCVYALLFFPQCVALQPAEARIARSGLLAGHFTQRGVKTARTL